MAAFRPVAVAFDGLGFRRRWMSILFHQPLRSAGFGGCGHSVDVPDDLTPGSDADYARDDGDGSGCL